MILEKVLRKVENVYCDEDELLLEISTSEFETLKEEMTKSAIIINDSEYFYKPEHITQVVIPLHSFREGQAKRIKVIPSENKTIYDFTKQGDEQQSS